MKIKLISFPICPYVHRCAITLKFKSVDYDIEYIDLKNKPEWFLKLSPMGKVPVMMLDDKDVIFESSVINELIDELFGKKTLSEDTVTRAKERAWIEIASACLGDFHMITSSADFKPHFKSLLNKLKHLESVISDNGFFKDAGFSIVDSSYAPLFFRLKFIDALWYDEEFMNLKKVYAWAKNLIEQDYVKKSVKEDFADLFMEYLKSKNTSLIPVSCSI
jgi:glutathione S-transferase